MRKHEILVDLGAAVAWKTCEVKAHDCRRSDPRAGLMAKAEFKSKPALATLSLDNACSRLLTQKRH